MHGPDRVHELSGHDVLQQVGLGSGLQRAMDVLVAFVHGESDEAAARELRADLVMAWTPSIPGRPRSITVTSGRRTRYRSTASSPVPASPTTDMSGSRSTTAATP